ncbi:flagellar hook-associated protein FlgL (plasmid) [Paenibacillus cellulosilyticus]|nr:flagellar hook-associated protein FlgL [Paenibacillus cellulosilyticus]
MRVTNSMATSQLISNLNNNLGKMIKQQNQLSTGMKLNKPSDDPTGITYALRYRSELSANSQYQSNTNSAVSLLDQYDTQLDESTQIMQRVKELVVEASNGTNTDSSLAAINEELQQLKQQMVDIANTRFNGKYIFNGEATSTKPYADGTDAKSVSADSGSIIYPIGEGISMNVNLNASEVFGDADAAGTTDNVFSIFDRLNTALSSGDTTAAAAELDNIENRTNKIINARSEVGARTNRAELMQERLDSISSNLTEMQSETEDADIDQLYTSYSSAQATYNAALKVGAQIISSTLVDFIS